METKYTKCKVCGVEIAGFGKDNLDKNILAHMNDQHKFLEEHESYTWEEIEDMTKKELLELFDGDDINKSMTKKKIIEAIFEREQK